MVCRDSNPIIAINRRSTDLITEREILQTSPTASEYQRLHIIQVQLHLLKYGNYKHADTVQMRICQESRLLIVKPNNNAFRGIIAV